MEDNFSKSETRTPTTPLEILSPDGRLVLRQYVASDAEEAFALISSNKEHLSQFGDETYSKYPTLETFAKSITHPKNLERLRFGIRNKDGVLVGSINLTPDDDNRERGEIGYYLGAAFQKKGYARQAVMLLTEYAFNRLGYRELYGKVVEENELSGKVLAGAGYRETKRREGKIIFEKEKPKVDNTFSN